MNTTISEDRIRWNTGRSYTAQGQRLAAQSVGRDVLLVDADRGIEYLLPDCDLVCSVILDRYDRNDRCEYPAGHSDTVGELWKFAKEMS
jgi:hypothetical protein